VGWARPKGQRNEQIFIEQANMKIFRFINESGLAAGSGVPPAFRIKTAGPSKGGLNADLIPETPARFGFLGTCPGIAHFFAGMPPLRLRARLWASSALAASALHAQVPGSDDSKRCNRPATAPARRPAPVPWAQVPGFFRAGKRAKDWQGKLTTAPEIAGGPQTCQWSTSVHRRPEGPRLGD